MKISSLEKSLLGQGYLYVVGCDEVGRGALAGPVVASAVVVSLESLVPTSPSRFAIPLRQGYAGQEATQDKKLRRASASKNAWMQQIDDSKKLSAAKRLALADVIKRKTVAWVVHSVSHKDIDRINIHQATLLVQLGAIKKVLKKLNVPNETVAIYIDGKFVPPELSTIAKAVVGGDGKLFCIASASIIAKVYRDNLMMKLGKKFPKYEFAKHKGYGTLVHRKAILKHGLTPFHRTSFCGNILMRGTV